MWKITLLEGIEEIKELTTDQGEDYTTGCLLDYDYIKNLYSLIVVDVSRQRKLEIQEIGFVWQWKNIDGVNTAGTESIFVLTILEKIKETRLKFS